MRSENKNVSEIIIEHENHDRDRDMSDKTKKGFQRTRTP